MMSHDGERDWLHYVSVVENARGEEVGGVLVERACQWLRRQAMLYVTLMVRPEHQHSVSFYMRLGFAIEPRPMRRGQIPDILMSRWVNAADLPE